MGGGYGEGAYCWFDEPAKEALRVLGAYAPEIYEQLMAGIDELGSVVPNTDEATAADLRFEGLVRALDQVATGRPM